MATCNANDLLAASSSFMGLSDRNLRIVTASILCKMLKTVLPVATCDPKSLLEAGACFNCASDKQIQVIIAQLLCEILVGGATPGATCLLRGAAGEAPNVPPPCPLSIWASTAPNEGVWFGDSTTGLWEEVIAPGP